MVIKNKLRCQFIKHKFNLFKIFKYIKYSSTGLVIKFLRKIFYFKIEEISPENIAVLGRGASANEFFDNNYKEFNRIFMINYSQYDLKLNDYKKLINKKITLISNITEVTPNQILLLFWNIYEVILVRPNYYFKSKAIFDLRENFKLNGVGVKVRGFINLVNDEEFQLSLKNSGLVGIYEAAQYCQEKNIKNLFLFGFDFYETIENKNNTLYDDLDSEKKVKEHLGINKKLLFSFEKIANRFSDVTFHITTKSNYIFSNLNIKKTKI